MIIPRLRRRRKAPATRLEERRAELATTQAVAAFVASGTPPVPTSLPYGHRRDGLSGARMWRILTAHADAFANKPDRGTAALNELRRSLRSEIDGATSSGRQSPRYIAHLQKLLAFAIGLWAYRSAEAKRAGTKVDDAEVAAAASEAVCMSRDEPYLRALQAETLLLLGRAGEAAGALAAIDGAPWLAGWQEHLSNMLERSRRSASLLPIGSAAAQLLPIGCATARLQAMSEQKGWLKLADKELPNLLLQETVGREALEPRFSKFVLAMAAKDIKQDKDAERIIGPENASVESSTIQGLRSALRQRFGVVLPAITLRPDATLPVGQAVITFEERRAGATDAGDLALAAQEDWWPGMANAPHALHALLVAAMRSLVDMHPHAPDASRNEEEARVLMLADRMPFGLLAEQIGELVRSGTDPVSAVAALRLRLADGAQLWGNDATRRLLLLGRTSEDALQAGVVPGIGMAAAPELFANLAKTLRNLPHEDPGGSRERQPTLVLRDAALRPLLRALLQDNFPDLPVLAMAEITQPRILEPLGGAASP